MRCRNFKFRESCNYIPSTGYLTHNMHTYTAKFIPHMPSFFIKKYAKENDIILDPFCGSGTTLVEAKINGINSLGIDLNPLARLITKAKTHPPVPEEIEEVIKKLEYLLQNPLKLTYNVEFPNKDYWFHKKTTKDLRKIMSAINLLEQKQKISNEMKSFLLASFSSIIRHSSYADPRNPKTYCSPKMRMLRDKNIAQQPIPLFLKALKRNANSVRFFYERVKMLNKKPSCRLITTNDATNIWLPANINQVDMIITSPPYANAQEYFRNIKLELFWLNLANRDSINKLDKKQIGGENHAAGHYRNLQQIGYKEIDTLVKKIFRKDQKGAYIVYKYFYNMEKVLQECNRVLKKDKHLIIIIGDNTVRKVHIPTHNLLIQLAQNNGFKLYELGYDNIQSRSFMIKRNNSAPIIKKDWIIDLLKK